MKRLIPQTLGRPTLIALSFACVPLSVHAAEPVGGEQEAPAAGALPAAPVAPAEPAAAAKAAPSGAAHRRKSHGKPRTLEQLMTSPTELEEPPAMLQKEAPSVEPPCQSDPAELQILLSLRERRLELDGRERTVQAREVEFKQAQRKIDDRVEQLNLAVARLEARLELGEPGRLAREGRIKTLVDGLSTLSAKKAAPILAETEPALVSELMQRLGSTRTAALLAVMPTVKAARIVNITGGPRQPGVRSATPAPAAAPPPAAPAKADAPPAAATPSQQSAPTPADTPATPADSEKKP